LPIRNRLKKLAVWEITKNFLFVSKFNLMDQF